jgi:hypothetical protein
MSNKHTKRTFWERAKRLVAVAASAGLLGGGVAAAVVGTAAPASADTQSINFESGYSLGSVDGQNAWTSTGPYDQAVVDNSTIAGAPGSFQTRSLRISDAVTSGSFGDQTFSPPTTNAAGEPGADTGGYPVGTLQNHFDASFSFASVTPGAEQSGLHMSVSPDRGDGARMSYVRIEDSASGWNIFFDDYQDAPPLGSGGNLDNGCGVEDNFIETQIATGLTRAVPHTLSFVMDLIPGPHNDIVTVLLDGNAVHTGTSWEDYYRYCAESGGGTGGPLADQSRIVRNVEFRESGTADPGNAGAGFLIDGIGETSAQDCTTTCYVATTGNDAATGQLGDPLQTIQAGVNKVSPGGTVQVAAGTYVENVTVPQSVHITGAGVTTVVEPAISDPNCGGGGGSSLCPGGSNVFLIQSSDVTIDHLEVNGDNPSLSGVSVGGANVDARNGIIEDFNAGTFNNTSVHDVTVKNVFLRGIYASSGGTGFSIANNIVDNVQGDTSAVAIFNFGGSGSMTGNHVSNANDAISSNWSEGTTYTGNVVTTSGSGVHSDNNGGFFGPSTGDVISGNTVSSCTPSGYGIFSFVPYLPQTISGNTVSGCDTGLAVFASCDLGGTNSCAGGVIPTVTLTTNHVTDTSFGIGLDVSTTSFGFGDGEVHANANHNVISGAGKSVYVEETGTAHATAAVNRNSLISVQNAGVTSVNGTCNWWGQSTGPATGQVTGTVTTSPFLGTSNLAGPCPAPTVPTAPRPTSAVPFGDHQAKVIWMAPVSNGGSPITGYIITPYLAGVAQPAHVYNSTATTELVPGLTDSQSYRFAIAAKNAVGTGPMSTQTAAMIAGAPGQPAITSTVKPVSGSLKVTFSAPSNNGAAITSYTATCTSTNGGVTKSKTGPSSPLTVSALTAGKTYHCTVKATNSRGTGPSSQPGAAVNA